MFHLTRRAVLIGSAAWVTISGPRSVVADASGDTLFRGVSQRGRIPRGFGFATNWAQGARIRHVLPVPFRRIKLLLPTFCVETLSDVDFASAADVQAAIEYPYQMSVSDLGPRRRATFSGVNGSGEIGHYDPAIGPFAAIMTDAIDLGVTVPAGVPFGSWVSLEFSARTSQGINTLPVSNVVGSLTYPTFEGVVTGSASFVDRNWCRSAASVASASLRPTEAFVPLVIVDCGPGTRSYLILGDSIAAGVNEGVGGTGTKGDLRGDADGNSGWVERWLARNHIPFVNFSKASQRLANMADPLKSRRQHELAGMMGVTDLLIALGTNDIFKRKVPQLRADLSAIVSGFRTAIGADVPVHLSTLLPKSVSTGVWTAADGADQTALAHFGHGTKAAEWNALVRSLSLANIDDIDPQGIIQTGDADSFLWKGDGATPGLYTIDGVHPTSDGYDLIATGLPRPR